MKTSTLCSCVSGIIAFPVVLFLLLAGSVWSLQAQILLSANTQSATASLTPNFNSIVYSTVPGDGLSGTYFNNKTLTKPYVHTRIDNTVDFNWGYTSPAPEIITDAFSVRWLGQVVPQYSETYTFYTHSDDGIRLWVNGQLLINNWTNHALTEDQGSISLIAGARYNIVLEFYDRGGAATARLWWASASQPKQIIPQTALYSYLDDFVAPSIPDGLTVRKVTSGSVLLSWKPSADNSKVAGYKIYRSDWDYEVMSTADTFANITGLTPLTRYKFSVSAIDIANNESTKSNSIDATTGVTSTSAWQTVPFSTQAGTFTVEFDVMPNNNSMYGLIGLLNGTAQSETDLACIIRFNGNGKIDARNGGVYSSNAAVGFSAGVNFHFRVEVNRVAHTYSVYVTPQGKPEILLASDFAFRVEQTNVTTLNALALAATWGSHTVYNIAFTQKDTEPPSAPTGLTGVYGSYRTVKWNASIDNVAVKFYRLYEYWDWNWYRPIMETTSTQCVFNEYGNSYYPICVTAVDYAGNESAPSNTFGLYTGITTFDYTTMLASFYPSLRGRNTVEMDVEVNDDFKGFVLLTRAYSQTICEVRFDSLYLSAANGVNYDRVNQISSQNTYYRFRFEIDIASQTYSVYVSGSRRFGYYPPSKLLASNYTFATPNVSEISEWGGGPGSGEDISMNSTISVYNVSVTRYENGQPPSTPTNLTASNITQSSVVLAWNPSTDDVGVTKYMIHIQPEPYDESIQAITPTSVKVTGLEPGTRYRFSVRAFDAVWNSSESSNQVTIYTLPAAGSVASLTDTAVNSLKNDIVSDDLTSTNRSVLIYPNPAHDVLYIESPAGALVKISDQTGKYLLTREIYSGKTSIPISLKRGMYFIEIINAEKQIERKKLMVY